MTMPHRVEQARAGDRDTLLALLLKAFRHHHPTHPLFDDLYPDLFLATDAAMGRHFLIRDDAGLPVSCVGLYRSTCSSGARESGRPDLARWPRIPRIRGRA